MSMYVHTCEHPCTHMQRPEGDVGGFYPTTFCFTAGRPADPGTLRIPLSPLHSAAGTAIPCFFTWLADVTNSALVSAPTFGASSPPPQWNLIEQARG